MKAPSRYLQPVTPGLFDTPHRLRQLQQMGDPLAALNAVVDWTIFVPVLARIPRAEPKRLAHKDLDARWTKKNQQTYYGYKDHIVADLESKLIVRAQVTAASTHDSQALGPLTRAGDPATWADSAYAGAPCQAIFTAKGIVAQVCEKGVRGQALTKGQKRSNRKKSRQRARVEHIFGFKTGSMGAMFQRVIGFARNRAGIILTNLVYNLARTEQIIRLKLLGRKTPQLV